MRTSERVHELLSQNVQLERRIEKLEELLRIDDEYSRKRNYRAELSGNRFIDCVEEMPLVERIWEIEKRLDA